MLPDEKGIAFRNEKNFIDTVNSPLIAGGRIFRKLNRYLGAERYFYESAIIFFAENEIAHILMKGA